MHSKIIPKNMFYTQNYLISINCCCIFNEPPAIEFDCGLYFWDVSQNDNGIGRSRAYTCSGAKVECNGG